MQHAPHRREDDRLTTGRGRYTDDIPATAALRTAFVRSPFPAARVRAVDTAAALAHPGVVAVLTGSDLRMDGFLQAPELFRLPQGDGTHAVETPRPLLAMEQVRFVGEPVAMVLATSLQASQDAAERVVVDYEELDAIADTAAARAPAARQLWDQRPGNVAFRWAAGASAAVDAALASAHHVARLEARISRVAAMPLEPRAALAWNGDDGRPVLHLSHQSPHQMRDELAKMFRLPATGLRVVTEDVGGSFGMKFGALREEMLVFWAALRLRRAVRWTALRNESFLADEHARDVVVTSELGLDAQGRFTALRVGYQVNVGAYMSVRSVAPVNNIGGISGVYATPAVAAEVVGVFTNTQTTAAYRGAGRPDATYAIERVIDIAAAQTGIDPAELRRRNLIPAAAMPYHTGFRFEYDCGDFERNLAHALALADYASFAGRRAQARQRGRLRGIGIAMPIELAGSIGADRATVQAHADGTVSLAIGSKSVGQGHETSFSLLLAQALGIAPTQVRYLEGDTDQLPAGRGNGGSSAAIQGGSALVRAKDDLLDRARALAATALEVHPDDLAFAEGAFQVRGTDRVVRLAELARGGAVLLGSGDFAPSRPTFPNGCHVCEVEIDPATGQVTPVNYVAVEDVGTVLQPVLVEGQLHGGIAQGMGQVLLEEICHDAGGQLVTGSFMDYAMPRAADLPPMRCVTLETPTATNPLGVKGVGEAGTVGAMSATMNAVCHALLPEGVLHLDMPATPARVWQALQDARGAGR